MINIAAIALANCRQVGTSYELFRRAGCTARRRPAIFSSGGAGKLIIFFFSGPTIATAVTRRSAAGRAGNASRGGVNKTKLSHPWLYLNFFRKKLRPPQNV